MLRMHLHIPFDNFLFPNYNINYYEGKYTIYHDNPRAPPHDNMDGGTDGTEDNQNNISDHICYKMPKNIL